MKLNNKLFRNAIMAGAFGLLAVAVAACDQDPKPDWNEPAPVQFDKTAVSIAEGAVVPASTPVLTITYAQPVAINSLAPITLNGSAVTAQLADANTISIALSLIEGQSYVLDVPARAIAGRGTQTFAPAFTLNFSTEAKPVTPASFGDLCNANATAQAKNVYNFFKEQNGKKIVTGAMANVNNNNEFSEWVETITGKLPAINGYDFIHLPESLAGQNWIDYMNIAPAQSWWDNNGLVQYMWHWRVPTDEQAYNDKDYNKYGTYFPGTGDNPTEFDIREALKEGTWEHKVIMDDINAVADVLAKLQEANIPVIWRPLHEAAGSYVNNQGAWFWWGRYGDEYVIELWKLMYNELVNVRGLNNLIWVWTAQYAEGYEAQMKAAYPGDEYVDIVGVDIYATDDNSQLKAYQAVMDMTGGKKIPVISETGLIQSPAKCLADGAKWGYFMLWYTTEGGKPCLGFGNTEDSLLEVFTSQEVINRGDMPSLK